MSRPRSVPPVMDAPTHNGIVKPCVVMTECAVHTIALPEGHFSAIVHSLPGDGPGVIAILDRDEVEAHIAFLRNAMDDADRMDRGQPALHAADTLRRQ